MLAGSMRILFSDSDYVGVFFILNMCVIVCILKLVKLKMPHFHPGHHNFL